VAALQAEYAEEEGLRAQSAERERQRDEKLASDAVEMTRLRRSTQLGEGQGA
jgi:hypothetical protein